MFVKLSRFIVLTCGPNFWGNYILRLLYYVLIRNEYISDEGFWFIQLVLTVLTLLLGSWINKRAKKAFKGKLKNLSITSAFGSGSGGLLIFFIFVMIFFVGDVLKNMDGDVHIFAKFVFGILLYTGSLIYLLAISFLSNSTKIQEVYFLGNFQEKHIFDIELFNEKNGTSISSPEKKEREFISTDLIDENDIGIVKVEANMKNMRNRSESYTLESVFIGALAFSGFLTIVSSDKVQENIDSLSSIVGELNNLLNSLLIFDLSESKTLLDNIIKGWNLFALISLECLICSTFFVLVLATRIKFTDLIEKLNYLIELSKIFNSKEEEIFLLKQQSVKGLEQREEYLKDKITLILNDSTMVIKEIKPIFNYMILFRNLGLYTFYAILITSGLFFSYEVSFVILGFFFIGYILKTAFTIFNNLKIERITNKYLNRKNI